MSPIGRTPQDNSAPMLSYHSPREHDNSTFMMGNATSPPYQSSREHTNSALSMDSAASAPYQSPREHTSSAFSMESATSPPLSGTIFSTVYTVNSSSCTDSMMPQQGSIEEQRMLIAVYNEIKATQPEQRPPPLGYQCHVCGSIEHYIRDCPEVSKCS